MLARVGYTTILPKLILQQSYYKIGLEESSRNFTAFVKTWGSFRFQVPIFGLQNALAMLQTIMTKVLDMCKDCSLVHIHDILVYSDSRKNHANHKRKVTWAIRNAGLKVKKGKM